MSIPHPIRKRLHGTGRAVLQALGRDAVFSELSFTYPLKLVSPKIAAERPVAIAYILSYGGGLISGDQIDIVFDVGANAVLQLLTQGSTKVFRTRTTDRLRASSFRPPDPIGGAPKPADITVQTLRATIAAGASLFLLPDPVTCFSGASYSQTQTFVMEAGATLCLLDWYTSGRMKRGEEWEFERYRSVNEVWYDGRRIARDGMLLENSSAPTTPLAPRSLKERMNPYSCYASVLLFGPLVHETASSLKSQLESISQFQRSAPADLIWSFSALEHGGIVRVAGIETETVKDWLKVALLPVAAVVGAEAYDKAFI